MNMDDLANALNKSNTAPKAKGGQAASSQPDLGGLLDALGGGQQSGGGQPDLGSLLGALGGGQQSGVGRGRHRVVRRVVLPRRFAGAGLQGHGWWRLWFSPCP